MWCKIKAFLDSARQHPKTTASGLAIIGAAAGAVVNDWHTIANPAFWMGLIAAYGLICASDGKTNDNC